MSAGSELVSRKILHTYSLNLDVPGAVEAHLRATTMLLLILVTTVLLA